MLNPYDNAFKWEVQKTLSKVVSHYDMPHIAGEELCLDMIIEMTENVVRVIEKHELEQMGGGE